MLRPATPLTVILFIAFATTLISILTTPVIPGIYLSKSINSAGDTVTYGVFGYCEGNKCQYKIGYDLPGTPVSADDGDFSVGSMATRQTLTNILIVHPVGVLFQLVCLILSLIAHFHSPSHSSRYLLGLIVFMLPTLLVTLLAFLVDILLFIPHLNWPGWLVLVAVVLDVLAGIMLCAMRRTLVSRKARTKRIHENAEMSGENFYNRQAAQAVGNTRADSPPPLDDGPTVPMVDGSHGADKLPQFATYEASSGRKFSEDRVPLNERTDTATTASSGFAGRPSQDGSEAFAAGNAGRGGPMNRGRGGRPYAPARDEFGNPLPPSSAFGPNPSRPDSRSGMYRGRGGPPRGGPGGYGRGGPVAPYGAPGRASPSLGRGGMGPGFTAGAAAGALAGDMGRGRGPPPGYSNESYQMQDRPPMNGAYGPRRQSPGPPSAPGYGQRRQSPGPPSATGYSRGPSSPHSPPSPVSPYTPGSEGGRFARADSPPPMPGHVEQFADASAVAHHGAAGAREAEVFHDAEMSPPHESTIGQAVEMDARTGSPAQSPGLPQPGFGQFHRNDSPLRQGSVPPISPSAYSSQHNDSVYVPARQAWQSNAAASHPSSPTAGSVHAITTPPAHHVPKPSGDYYEDVEPRFSGDHHISQHAAPTNIGVALEGPYDQQQQHHGQRQSYGSHPGQGAGYAY